MLPDHLHRIWTLPPDDDVFATRWRVIKTVFVRNVPFGERRCDARLRKVERGLWQRRFWEHAICNDDDFAAYVGYVHFNPFKHGYLREPAAWPYSTFKSTVWRGVYPERWLGPAKQSSLDKNWGE